MNSLDWILSALIILLALRCLFRGFVAEILSVAAYVAGLLAALLLYRPAGALVRDRLGVKTLPEVLGFVAVFIAAFVVVKILERLIHQALDSTHLDMADRILGLVLGLGEGLIAASLILIVLSAQPLFNVKKILDGSLLARHILPVVGPELSKALAPALKDAPALKIGIPSIQKP